MFRGEIRGEQGKEDDLQDGLPKQSFFETNFNMTLDIVGRIVGSHKVTHQNTRDMLNFTISKRWDGRKEGKSGNVMLSLEQGKNETVVVNILAPFFGNPKPPGGAPGTPYIHLWDYETVELFFLNNREQYLEVQVRQRGFIAQHIVMLGAPVGANNCFSFPIVVFLMKTKPSGWSAWTLPPHFAEWAEECGKVIKTGSSNRK